MFSRNRRSSPLDLSNPTLHNHTAKMGFLSKKKDDGDESNRNALFGSRKKSEKAPAQSNPCM